MKTFEGIMKIKWHKNDRGDWRPLTIDLPQGESLKIKLKEIRKKFLEIGEQGVLPISVSFDLSERK